MAEGEAKKPDLLAIGISTGGQSPTNQLVDEALASYMRMVMMERGLFPNEGLRINIVFHVPGPIPQPDYAGIRATKLDRKNNRVLIVAAVPGTLKFDEVSRYFADVLREARQKAADDAVKRTVPASAESCQRTDRPPAQPDRGRSSVGGKLWPLWPN